MENVLDIAFYLCNEYRREAGGVLDEMKLHKLLYFAQRESLVRSGSPLFGENFEGWKYGPVCIPVRKAFREGVFDKEENYSNIEGKLTSGSKSIICHVIKLYGKKESWSLSSITHFEYSWQQSRIGIPDGENGNNVILLDNIRIDAERIRKRREKLRNAQSSYVSAGLESYVPVISENDIFLSEDETVDVNRELEKIYDRVRRVSVRRRFDGEQKKRKRPE